MRRPIWTAVLGLCLVCAIASGQTRDAVTLYTSFEHQPSEALLQAMEDEVEAILSPISAQVVWRSLESSTGNERQCATKLAVVHFQGKCDTLDLTPLGAIGATLGTTHVSDENVQPFCDIYTDAIRGQVAGALAAVDAPVRTLLYGRAMARVLAHELYHVFSQSKSHGRNGLMRSAYTSDALLSPALRFQPAEYEKLRTFMAVPRANVFEARPASPGLSVFLGSGCSGCHGVRQDGTPFGPPLSQGKKLRVGTLASRLSSKTGAMFRRARSMKAVWPSLSPQQLAELAAFLSGRSVPK